MTRRLFVAGLAGGLLGHAWTALAQARQKVARIGYLRRTSLQPGDLDALRQGLRELGYVEGRNLRIEERYADGDAAKLPRLARELLDLKVDVLVVDGTLTVKSIREVAGATPIVFAFVGDPVKEGFVASLDRPGGNVTGLTNFAPQLAAKRLQLLREVVPAGRVGVLNNPANVASSTLEQFREAARSLGVDLTLAAAQGPAAIPGAFKELKHGAVASMLVWVDAVFFGQRRQVVQLATEARLPAIYPEREYCDAGGLLCYGPSISANFRRVAAYVDKILKGARPGDLPVEQPTKFELVINLKAAKSLGLTIPPSLLTRADEVISL